MLAPVMNHWRSWSAWMTTMKNYGEYPTQGKKAEERIESINYTGAVAIYVAKR